MGRAFLAALFLAVVLGGCILVMGDTSGYTLATPDAGFTCNPDAGCLCTSAAQCDGGQVCCAGFTDGGVGSACAAACSSTSQIQLCATSSECDAACATEACFGVVVPHCANTCP